MPELSFQACSTRIVGRVTVLRVPAAARSIWACETARSAQKAAALNTLPYTTLNPNRKPLTATASWRPSGCTQHARGVSQRSPCGGG